MTPKPFSIFYFTEFKDYLTGRFLFVMGLRMLSTLLGWWLYEITGSVLAIGLIGLAEVSPAIGLAFHTGSAIDRRDKRKILLAGTFAFGICALSLLLFSLLLLDQPHLKKTIIAAIYAVVICMGIIKAFLAPTFQAIMSGLVSKAFLPSATTWNSASWLFGGIAGHAIAGFSIAYLGVTATLIFIASLIFCSFFMFFLIFPKPPVTVRTGIGINNWQQFKEGLNYIISNKVLLGALSLDLFTVFFGGIVAIIPAVARDIFHTGPVGFAWLNVAADIGSAVVLLFLILSPIKRRQGLKLFFTVAIFGVSIIIFAFSRSFMLSFSVLVISGMADAVNSVIRGTILQLKTPDHIRGRVMSISAVFTNSSNELGRLESGLAASFMGTMPSIFFGGAMALFVVVITFIKTPSLRRLEY